MVPTDVGRVSVNHEVTDGGPCVAGTRIPVATIVGLIAEGETFEEIIADYPQRQLNGIRACLRHAARAVDERELPVRLPHEAPRRQVPANSAQPRPAEAGHDAVHLIGCGLGTPDMNVVKQAAPGRRILRSADTDSVRFLPSLR